MKMLAIYLQLIGCGVFVMSVLILGAWLRRYPSKKAAETTSRIVHFVMFFALLLPMAAWLTEPGFREYDQAMGMTSLPFTAVSTAVGAVMVLIGSAFMLISIAVLFDRGEGLPAFKLSKKLAVKDIYKFTRNPMSLGFYLLFLGIGLCGRSTVFTLLVLAAIIPSHIFFLKYFEEWELEIRFGQPYSEYKRKVPFLIPGFRRSSGAEPLENDESS
jgi:protein-S-isoprenylcysteine O-methyltransferase Ste14